MTATGSKRVVVCADDFGLTDAASQSIAALAAVGAISATSCVVDGRFAKHYASTLLSSGPSVSLGLHFNLTELTFSPLSGSLRAWLLRSFFRSVDPRTIAVELHRQLDVFESLFKRPPQFVDGHEHVHQFPVIRDALVDVLSGRYGTLMPVRCTVPRVWRGVKAQIIAGLGGRKLQRDLTERGWHTNTDFAGVYDFGNTVPYARRMQAWLMSIADGGLIMCHPELPAMKDAPLTARYDEHRFLASAAWAQQRETAAIHLIPFARTEQPTITSS